MHTLLNPHIANLKESATLRINHQIREMRRRGEQVFHFGFGQSPFPVHPKIVSALQENAHQKDYLSTMGLYELREAISAYHQAEFGYRFSPENILIGPGSKELMFLLQLVFYGDLVVPAPS